MRHPTTSGRSSPRRRVLLTAGVLILVGLLLATLGSGNHGAPSPQLRLTSARGAIELSDSRAGRAILVAHRLRPGGSVRGQVTIANTGRAAGLLGLSKSGLVDTPGAHGGRLSKKLELSVEEVTGQRRRRAYRGKLGAMPTLSLASLSPGQSRKYRFTVRFPRGVASVAGDNAYQGSSVRVAYVWGAEEVEREGKVIYGTGGPETLVGTPGNDLIISGGGPDRVDAGGGDDVVRSASGSDRVEGGAGDDRLVGGSGADVLAGGPGDDKLVGASGEDRLWGGPGNDRLDGQLERVPRRR